MANKLAQIKNMIYEIRGQKVMLDRDIAELYGVELKVLNQAAKRNIKRFPADFMFRLTQKEAELHKLLMLHIENADYKFSEYDETINIPHPKGTGYVVLVRYLSRGLIPLNRPEGRELNPSHTIRQIVQALNNLVEQPRKTRRIGFTAEE